MTPPPADLPLDTLVAALRSCAKGDLACEAAVELLITEGTWIRRADIRRWIDYTDDPKIVGAYGPLAYIDWPTVTAAIDDGLAASSGELCVLKCATSLVGRGRWPLSDMTGSLDAINLTALFNAVAHAKDWHEKGTQTLVNGNIADGHNGRHR